MYFENDKSLCNFSIEIAKNKTKKLWCKWVENTLKPYFFTSSLCVGLIGGFGVFDRFNPLHSDINTPEPVFISTKKSNI